jgi:hypothetical protein
MSKPRKGFGQYDSVRVRWEARNGDFPGCPGDAVELTGLSVCGSNRRIWPQSGSKWSECAVRIGRISDCVPGRVRLWLCEGSWWQDHDFPADRSHLYLSAGSVRWA